MCGRFTLVNVAELFARFQLEEQSYHLSSRYNIAPSQEIPVIIRNNGVNQLALCKWGLIPRWSKDPAWGAKLINARAETLEIKPSFKHSFQKRRCLIPADSFFEWKKEGNRKVPYRFLLKRGELFAFAGLWDQWTGPDGQEIKSCTIITTTANALVGTVHSRMPVILKKEEEKLWLDERLTDSARLKSLLKPYPAELMQAYEVEPVVNSAKIDDERCIAQARRLFS